MDSMKTTPELPNVPISEPVYLAGGEVDQSSVSLRFFGDDLDPDEITRLLSCRPSIGYRKGDILPNARHNRVAETGSWRLHGEKTGEKSLEQQILKLFSLLSDNFELWQSLTRRHKADLFCGLWMESWNRGIDFSPKLLAQISARGLILDLDIYYVGKDDFEMESSV